MDTLPPERSFQKLINFMMQFVAVRGANRRNEADCCLLDEVLNLCLFWFFGSNGGHFAIFAN